MRESFGQVNLVSGSDSKKFYRRTGEPRPSITIPQFRVSLTLIEAAMLAADLNAAVEAAEKLDAEPNK